MSEKELDLLAIKIADNVFRALLSKQQEWDRQFYAEYEELKSNNKLMSQEEVLITELKELEDQLNRQVKAEEFEKASITKNKITNIKNQIKKL